MRMTSHLKQPVNAMRLAGAGLTMALVLTCSISAAQTAGEVEFVRGVGFAQSAGQAPKAMAKGTLLQEGDRITTAEGASAIIRLVDGTRMTIRPGSELVLQKYKFKEDASDNSMVMQLLRGGLRAITGLISKNSQNAARLQTATATIGIRGTDFDARLCVKDCGAESGKITEKARPNAVQASAKVVSLQGGMEAVDVTGARRGVAVGGSLYPGDTLETAPASKVVLAFRDESRMTLGANTRFRVDSFVFDDKNPGEGRFLVSLLRGSMRALTGLIGKANNRNVGFTTPTATIGIRGTGLDVDCAASGCSFFNWLGSIDVKQNGQTALQVLQAGQGLFVSPQGIRPLVSPPPTDLPRPDNVQVDMKQLFTSNKVAEDQEGLFVFVRDGHIEVVTTKEILQLGRGEAGVAEANGQTSRPTTVPLFLQYDKIPLPSTKNPLLTTVLGEVGLGSSKVCP